MRALVWVCLVWGHRPPPAARRPVHCDHRIATATARFRRQILTASSKEEEEEREAAVVAETRRVEARGNASPRGVAVSGKRWRTGGPCLAEPHGAALDAGAARRWHDRRRRAAGPAAGAGGRAVVGECLPQRAASRTPSRGRGTNLNGSSLQVDTAREELVLVKNHTTGATEAPCTPGAHGGDNVTHVSFDAGSSLLARRDRAQGSFDYFALRLADGVAAGRYAPDAGPTPPPSPTAYTAHATAWNEQIIDRGCAVPRSYEVTIGSINKARFRLDQAPGQPVPTGRFKIYTNGSAGCAGEQLEYDMDIERWDGTELAFTIYGDGQAWRQARSQVQAAGRTPAELTPRTRSAGLCRRCQRPKIMGTYHDSAGRIRRSSSTASAGPCSTWALTYSEPDRRSWQARAARRR